jgi:N-dimethylarginine dimethylaminohydrolase
MNRVVLMSGAEFFGDADAINDLMDPTVSVNVNRAVAEHASIEQALRRAGVEVRRVAPPTDCQDGVYTANWGLVRDGRILMSRLPNTRKPEERYALHTVRQLGLHPVLLPEHVERFSGQGDALPCGDVVFTQSPYRTSTAAHAFIKESLGFKDVIALQTKPARNFRFGPAKTNRITGWPDSPTYDIDLALAVLKWPRNGKRGLIAYCPAVFKRASREVLRGYENVDKIEVSHDETLGALALNLLSTGETVVMNSGAPAFQEALESHGLETITLELPELRKGGGSIRCSTLTLKDK